MTSIAVVGGHGAIARLLHPLLVAAGHTPVALVRSEGHRADLEPVGAQVRMLDIENDDAAAFAAAFAGCGAVVFAAGGGADGDADRKRAVDLGGALKSIEGARVAGISRLVQISAIGVDAALPADSDPVWRAYVEAKRNADIALRESDLAWTIVRPGRLTDDAGTGLVTAATEVDRGDVPRADVAAVIAAVLADHSSIGRQFELVEGDTPIDAAIASLG